MDYYSTAIDGPAIGVCIAAGYLLYKTLKHYSALLIIAGFTLTVIGFITNGYCTGTSQIEGYIFDYPFLCHPATSYIRGVGFILVGYGLIKLNEHLKSV